ncbi:MAG: hypothetical protein ACYTAS_20870 [Planctomycetota bacterium]
MAKSPGQTVQFDILLKSPGSGRTPNVGNIDQFRAAPETIEKCQRWLASQGVDCYATDFGLACSAKKEVFETLFGTELRPSSKAPGIPPWQCALPPQPPPEIREYVDQVSMAAPPELF